MWPVSDTVQGPWVVGEVDADRTDRRTGRERVGDVLRERILAGELAPGDRIDLDKYAAEFGTSRTPVREACLALAQDGLVKVVQRSGVTVIGVSPEWTIENFQLMAALSGVAAQWAAGKISERDLLRVKELQREIRIASQSGEDITTLNWLFHAAINRACGSPRLIGMLSDAGRMIPRRFFALFPERVPCSLDDHEDLVRALSVRDGATARRIAEGHFDIAAKLLAEHLGRR